MTLNEFDKKAKIREKNTQKLELEVIHVIFTRHFIQA